MKLYDCYQLVPRLWNKLVPNKLKQISCAACGTSVLFGRRTRVIGIEHLHIGNDVSIGEGSLIMCSRADVTIGDHTMLAPGVTVITGGHRTDMVGRYMTSVTNEEKRPEDDRPICLKGDNWIGANATILKGVTIGEGAVVAAGAVVTKDIPPYEIWGVPAVYINSRFDERELEQHLSMLKGKNTDL